MGSIIVHSTVELDAFTRPTMNPKSVVRNWDFSKCYSRFHHSPISPLLLIRGYILHYHPDIACDDEISVRDYVRQVTCKRKISEHGSSRCYACGTWFRFAIAHPYCKFQVALPLSMWQVLKCKSARGSLDTTCYWQTLVAPKLFGCKTQ